MGIYVGILGLAFGLLVGSFINVVVDRSLAGTSFWTGRSICDTCKKTLQWYELIPVISYMLQKGRCRNCATPLSLKYPAVEIVTGIVSGLFVYEYGTALVACTPEFVSSTCLMLGVRFIALGIFLVGLLVLSIIDIRVGIIPDKVLIFLLSTFCMYVLFVLGLQVMVLEGYALRTWFEFIITSLQSGVLAFLFFYALLVATKGSGMGGGDVKLAFIIGLFLPELPTVIALYLAFVIGGVYGVSLLLLKKRRFGQTVPFGPFMALGAILSLLYSDFFLALFYSY